MAEITPSVYDFGVMAEQYEHWYETPVGKMYDRLEQAAVAELLPSAQRGSRLLDVGCGTGHWSRFFASRGFLVIGVDIAPEMIEIARSKDDPRCRFEVGDACRLPFPDGSFDVVTAITTLEFTRDAGAVVREMFRCLRPAGIVLIASLNRLAPVNRRRIRTGQQPYASTRLFSPSELRALVAPYGRVRIRTAGFVPRVKWVISFSPLLERAARWMNRATGALVVAEVQS